MQIHSAAAPIESNVAELFALSDEQILDIAPEVAAPADAKQAAAPEPSAHPSNANSRPDVTPDSSSHAASATSHTSHQSQVTSHDSTEPPPWLAAQMKDPWGGEEAREFWNGVQQARSEASACQAYRASFATPEDARALKELYPGGVSEARTAAERARLLDDVDRAYFGAAGNSPEQLSAARAELAQRMLREDPAAFREMVEAGIRVLQEAAGSQNRGTKSFGSVVSHGSRNASPVGNDASVVGAQHAVPVQRNQANPATVPAGATQNEAHLASYAAFERAANEDLERTVGSAIERTLVQALPSVDQHNAPGQLGAQRAAPLRERLAASVRADVEKTLQGDRQLGEQVAQILSSRRFDNETRSQIVRLISDRAQQLVPGAAKRVLNEWTQTTLAAHRGRTQRADAASAKADVALESVPARPAGSEQHPTRRQDPPRSSGQAITSKPQAINYRKLSDEQILNL